jgi:hypothetical protein
MWLCYLFKFRARQGFALLALRANFHAPHAALAEGVIETDHFAVFPDYTTWVGAYGHADCATGACRWIELRHEPIPGNLVVPVHRGVRNSVNGTAIQHVQIPDPPARY